jgi:imidazole glycerol phosphate synthase subunit HisF
MGNVRIVLVGPKFEGNVGAIARSMANFGFDELYIVDGCEIGDEAYRRAKHGSHILEGAVITDSLKKATDGCFLVVGTSGIVTKGENNYVRVPISVAEFADRMNGYGEKVAVLFGREDTGLDALEWIKRGVQLGAGELVINSIDTDGVKGGFDIPMLEAVCEVVDIPIIASGGAGCIGDFIRLFENLPKVDAGLAASIFHFGQVKIPELKIALFDAGINVRLGRMERA